MPALDEMKELTERLYGMTGVEAGVAWLQRPNPELDGATPLSMMGSTQGRDRLAEVIEKAED